MRTMSSFAQGSPLYRAARGRLTRGVFLSRPNRFRVVCETGGDRVEAYLPNPGRLWELLLPGSNLLLERSEGNTDRKTDHTVVAVETDHGPVMLHTHRTNDAAEWLIGHGLIPGWEKAKVIRREVVYGSSRIDFLMEGPQGPFAVEVKSCTLFGEKVAMFPDAPSERASRHIRHLAGMGSADNKPGLLIIVHSRHPRYFLPDFHTDLQFARAFLEARDKLEMKVAGIEWNSDLVLQPQASMLDIPWKVLEENVSDRGGYLLILELEKEICLSAGRLEKKDFPAGYYCYVGSAMKNLSARMSRHLRKRKNFHWHIDYLRDRALILACLPVRSAGPLECDMAQALKEIADGSVPGFGSSDCSCPSHLFRFSSNPLRSAPFIKMLLHFRIDRLM